jgi:hypothetical protein
MPDTLTATLVKRFFQYRCDRQARYDLLSPGDRAGLTIVEAAGPEQPWARAGVQFEAEVVAALARRARVLAPPAGERLTDGETAAFLHRRDPAEFAHQARLALPDPAAFRRRFGLDADVSLAAGYPDLLRAVPSAGAAAFRVIDVKAVDTPTVFHRAQVAYYALLLEELFRQLGVPAAVDPVGEIWHFPPDRSAEEPQKTPFALRGYAAQVGDFLRDHLARIRAARLGPGVDETAFHLGYKCEQCAYLPHCDRSAAPDAPPAGWDLSAVPGLSPTAKPALLRLGVRTVGELAAAGPTVTAPENGWSLRSSGPLLIERAAALVNGTPRRVADRFTCLMPPRVDAAVYLLCDRDPIEGRLATVGCLFEQGPRRELTVRAVTESGRAAERDALLAVLLAVLRCLSEVDAHNAANGDEDPWHAHVFVYEPTEAADLRDALGRHLADADVRGGLLHLVRMFPPEPLVPDPEYRGHRHLPATALRSVFDTLFALPARVTHDLARVSAALAGARPAPADPYRPAPRFARPFSSRLNLDCCRVLKAGTLDPREAEADVRARLAATAGLVRWLLADNARASPGYLRLKKEPFRWQATFDPLGAGDLELLRAQELLASRAAELAALSALAAPPQVRTQRFRCVGPMRLAEPPGPSPQGWAAVRLRFTAPADCAQAELSPETFNVLLTDNDPDLLLDPAAWPLVSVSIADLSPGPDGVTVLVDVGRRAWKGGPLKGRVAASPEGWWLDLGFADRTGGWMQDFLSYLDAGG